jgi:pimeloyl-ACP methyl ester carboxylesterase
VLQALRGLELERIDSREAADRALAEAIPEQRLRTFLLQNLVRRHGRYHWRVNLDAIHHHTRDLAGFGEPFTRSVFTGPALFVHGARSDYLKPEHEPAIRALFPAARIVPIERAGHWLHAERPEAFARAVEGFLEETAGVL